ncbi:MAG TPA: carbohydrate-binding family 9-like protein [Thermoanaerobaculia bacterium]|nr:carbohydrate-binding family 9-like protein [Thermoanaerobaculia bacterium]
MSDTLVVARGEFSMEDPWAIPPACTAVRLRRATDGAAPRLSTTVSAYFDDDHFTAVFCCADDHIVATMLQHDDPLYDEDVVEVFLAPRGRSEYFEIEVSPMASTFDARIESPGGVRESMRVDLEWECDGLVAAVRKTIEARRVLSLDTVIRVPFASVGCPAPRNGDSWNANFFRIDRHPSEGDEYSAWRPTMREPADFHVTAAFGRLLFQA